LENLPPRWVSESPEYSSVIVHTLILANVLSTIKIDRLFPSLALQRSALMWAFWRPSTIVYPPVADGLRRREPRSYRGESSLTLRQNMAPYEVKESIDGGIHKDRHGNGRV
jgi:hypothetical protein